MKGEKFEGWRILGWHEHEGQMVRLIQVEGMLMMLPPGSKTAVRMELCSPREVENAFRRGFETAVDILRADRRDELPPLGEDVPIEEPWFQEATSELLWGEDE